MKTILIIGGAVIALPIAGVTIYGIVRTQKVESDPRQKIFAAGRAPDTSIDGLYHGSLQGREVSWKGKKFQSADATGINVFQSKEGAVTERFPFRTYSGRGIKDKKTAVLKIDYGQKGNPWWLRRIVDEVVEVGPGELLGKVHVKWILGMTFTMGYFKLEKATEASPAPDGSPHTTSSAG
jgi:hypothetical protein